jgi:hypothetical protein
LTIGDEIAPNKEYVNDLEDNILKKIMIQVEDIKIGKFHLNEA